MPQCLKQPTIAPHQRRFKFAIEDSTGVELPPEPEEPEEPEGLGVLLNQLRLEKMVTIQTLMGLQRCRGYSPRAGGHPSTASDKSFHWFTDR